MATIQIILQAINNASGAFNDAADSAAKLDAALDAVESRLAGVDLALAATIDAADRLSGQLDATGAAADLAGRQLSDAGDSADVLNLAMATTAAAADDLAGRLNDASTAASRFAILTGGAGQAISDLRTDLATLAASADLAANRLNDVSDAAAKAAAATAASGAAVRTAGAAWGWWGGVVGGLTTTVSLWGGLLDSFLPHILTQVSAWHIWADAILEVVAVWGPALIGMGVYAASASQAVATLYTHISDMLTVVNATPGTLAKLYPLTGGFLAMQNAVQPAVYQLWGDAIEVAANKSGVLLKMVQELNPVVEQLGARITLALTSNGMTVFIRNAVQDVSQLGNAFGNLFGILGNIMKVLPGYANIMLGLGTAILGVLEHVTAAIEPVIQLGLALHGFILWVGLAVTGAVKLGPILAGWAVAAFQGAQDLLSLVRIIIIYVQQVGLMTAASELLAAVDPWVWVGLAVAALAGLVFWVSRGSTSVQQFAASVVTAAQQASTLTEAVSDLQAGATQTAADLATAQGNLATVTTRTAGATDSFNKSQTQAQLAVDAAAGAVNAAADAHDRLTGELSTESSRMQTLAGLYGGTANAAALLTSAGITNTQMLTEGANAFAQIKVQVQGTYDAMKSLQPLPGMLGNELQAMDRETTTSSGAAVSAIQKVQQAMDDLVSGTTAPQSTFDTYAQGLDTLSSDTATFTYRLGALTVTGSQAKAAIDSLSASGVNLNQAFTQQVGNVNQMVDTWRNAGLATNVFDQAVKDSIAPLTTYAAGSSEATAQLIALAEAAGYQGADSMQALTQWLGNTAGALQYVKDASNQATIQEALLTSAMQAQGNAITSQLIGDIQQAILAYNGVKTAAANYGNALAQYGPQSSEAKQAQDALTQSIIKSGEAANQTQAQIAAMIAKVLSIPLKVALQIVMNGEAQYSITQAGTTAQGTIATGGGQRFFTSSAGGWYVTGGVPNRDSVPILAMAGELVVPKKHVDAGLVDHLRGHIPGFAAGGLVGLAGNTAVMSGQAAVAMYGSFRATFETAVVHAMQGALIGAQRAASGGQSVPAARAPSGNLYDQGGLLPPGVSIAFNQTGSPELVLPNAVVQGFTMGLQQLHGPLSQLVSALQAQTAATQSAATATTTAAATTTTAVTKAATTSPPTQIQKDQAKIAADKANAAMLAQHIDLIKQAIADTPKSDKAALAREEAALADLQKALTEQNAATGKAEAALSQAIIAANEKTAAAMRAQIEAITKLLGASTASAVSPSGLWTTLQSDEKKLAAALAAIADQTSGKSGGSAAASTAASTASSAASLADIKSELAAAYDKLDSLEATEHDIDVKYKAAAAGSADKSDLYTQLQTLISQVNSQWATIDTLLAAEKTAEKTAGTASSASTASSSASSAGSSTGGSYTTVQDRAAENYLQQILAQVQQENAKLQSILTCLNSIDTEVAPKAQAAAIGPAVATALNSAGSKAANSKTTKRG